MIIVVLSYYLNVITRADRVNALVTTLHSTVDSNTAFKVILNTIQCTCTVLYVDHTFSRYCMIYRVRSAT